MAQNEYIVEGRSFRTEADYRLALRDKETMDRLRSESDGADRAKLERLLENVQSGKYKFYTLLGQDYEDELSEQIKQFERQEKSSGKHIKSKTEKAAPKHKASKKAKAAEKSSTQETTIVSEKAVQEELKRQEKRRKWTVMGCTLVAVVCLGYFGLYLYYNQRTGMDYDELIALKEKEPTTSDIGNNSGVTIHYTDDEAQETPEVLDEYKNLVNKNKKLIGWLKIDDTNIDYPVMQTSDNEYYLEHNLNQEYDKNGSIFMDKDCDVLKPSTNLIIYGHHMKSGKMFGELDKYSDFQYYQDHRYIDFDTIYEKGIYEVMYVFRSRVYSEQEVVFKYYQFIDAQSEVEFNSNMNEMASASLYDTGVTASYGDRLLTLSTCDYQEKNGRFVVVAKKVLEKE